ncbi:TetR/AcrR family transcriptional regulator [Ilumatobacter sp.]|uniref:TetR/AcrR family transcriptional regulator n=1 Tax=Ilumatobacter sp. TaxID=1967498 RepID=UPI003B52A61E
MGTRSESAAATRRALVAAALELLDQAGPDAVTLRAIAARAGVSRGAPYGHFDGKTQLLATLATATWNQLADEVDAVLADTRLTPSDRLETAVRAFLDLARRWPHRFALMFDTPADDVDAAAAAGRLQDLYVSVIATVVGDVDARRYTALLMSSAHGIAAMKASGHLNASKWEIGPDEPLRTLLDMVHATVASTALHSSQP